MTTEHSIFRRLFKGPTCRYGQRAFRGGADDEPPLRAELFSWDQMAQHGSKLAASHCVASGAAPDLLLGRLAENENVLICVCDLLAAAVAVKQKISPAAEWLLDNFYLVEEQIRTARRHLPKGYSRELPRLSGGPSAGRPRVYDIALEVVAHGDGRVDTECLTHFVTAYQSVTALTLGELWATPIMLRLSVIENLRRVCLKIADDWDRRSMADMWADQMIDAVETDPKSLILVVADMARSSPPMKGAFVAELVRRLQGRGPALALPLTWVQQHLAESGRTIEQLVQIENQQQAADQVSISNSIGSLRVLGAMDWQQFVESMSVVEEMLKNDPYGIYAKMDFATRDSYRHATERIAKCSHLAELDVARLAVEFARKYSAHGQSNDGSDRKGHVGYYLVGNGVAALEQAAAIHLPRIEMVQRLASRQPLVLYLGAIATLTLCLTTLVLAQFSAQPPGRLVYGLAVVLSLFVASQLAVSVTNWLATLLVTPRPLPKLDFALGIPVEQRAIVVVPTMLTSVDNADELAEALEVRFLANRDANLHFGLLTDLRDASQEVMPEDAALVLYMTAKIEALNQKYCGADDVREGSFYLFHRSRQWNARENVWMGVERKRGKLAALNALLLGKVSPDNTFSLIVGDVATLIGVRYVVTLDTDTQLPRDAARQFVGAMAHPLNRPVYDEKLERVTQGYGLLQPRMAISLPGANRSRYAKLYAGEAGIDPYTRAISDVYQDVFGEGSFVGKGIYDVAAFERCLGARLPKNRILSHDLLEGCYARSGLLSDVMLYEDYPARYRTDVARRHRWIRGDWQIAAWLWRTVPGEGLARRTNHLSGLSQWKLFDNLRRSLVPAAMVALLLLGWLLPISSWRWTAMLVGISAAPAICAVALELLRKSKDVLLSQHLLTVARSAARRALHWVFETACLPYEAAFSLDAIARAAWRVAVSRSKLLAWQPSVMGGGQVARGDLDELRGALRTMWGSCVFAMLGCLYFVLQHPTGSVAIAPFFLLWAMAPIFVWWISMPLLGGKAALTPDQIVFLRTIARRTWAYFEDLAGIDDHWLPPDNVQRYRVAAVAHRTSPTNMGLALMANLSAYDFGYIAAGQLIVRTENALQTMEGMERYRGHFYNWYDTQTLAPLPPLYISTVDSGNLAGHLLTLRPGLLALTDDCIFQVRAFAGLRDTFEVLAVSVDGFVTPQAKEFARLLNAAIVAPLTSLHATEMLLAQIIECARRFQIYPSREGDMEGGATLEGESGVWARAIIKQCLAWHEELAFLAPWLTLPPAPEGLEGFAERLDVLVGVPGLQGLMDVEVHMQTAVQARLSEPAAAAQRVWLIALTQHIQDGRARCATRVAQIEHLTLRVGQLARMEYEFLFDRSRKLLSIGYSVGEHRADAGYYDLLASEARLGCFVAIAQGKIPQASWFALGRLLTSTGGEPVLMSWSGSMFEYLMPLLVMPNYEGSLLDQTCKAAVARQIQYGRQRGVPWGISESGYNLVDLHLNYQYHAFGVPGLGLKRGLSDDLVVAPYASVMALMVAPEQACANLQRLAAEGYVGKFGFFEAIDYTASRQRRGQASTIVRAFMAHHQGMSLLALAYVILAQPMQRRFESDPLFQAVILLLQERIPKATVLFSHATRMSEPNFQASNPDTLVRIFSSPNTPHPEVQLLSNGRYHVMISNAGGGYSRWKDLAVTRWREDTTRDHWGAFCYIRDLATGAYWSSAYQPTLARPDAYEAIFAEGRAEFRRSDSVGGAGEHFETYTEIVVSPEDDIELRRIHVTNRSRLRREIDVTSYAEVVIAPTSSDEAHPAFSNLFVHTEVLPAQQAILCTRRPRSVTEHGPWMFHSMAVHGGQAGVLSYETDRLRFVGRGRSTAAPLAMASEGPLSGTAGSVLDPIVAIRHALVINPDQTVVFDIVSGVADSRDIALVLAEKYLDRHLADRVFDLAWSHSQVVLRQLNASEADSQLYARLASAVIYANAYLRAEASVLIRNRRGQSGLWGYAISGDLPIVLLQIADVANIALVRELVQAHAYWSQKGLAVDLVIWNEDRAGYRQKLQEQILGLIASGIGANVIDRPGGVFVRSAEQISAEDRVLFLAVARGVVSDSRGSLLGQFEDRAILEPYPPRLVTIRRHRNDAAPATRVKRNDLLFANGFGGFSADGAEYVIVLNPGQSTPAPWVNILANPLFGSVVSENGSAYTWSENAHEFRLTPWCNDPVTDTGGEALYVRDEETGYFWSPSPSPVRADVTYTVRHGFGYSVYECKSVGISTELWVYVAIDAAVKFSVLKVRNESGRARDISVSGYVEWVMGDLRTKTAMHVSTEICAQNGAIYARNPFGADFAERVGFFGSDEPHCTISGDRTEFIGRNGSLNNPAAMGRTHLSGRVGAGLDPCGAIQVSFTLADGQERETVFRLGVGRDSGDAGKLLSRYKGAVAARGALETVKQYWARTLGAVQVQTPEASNDLLANGWLLYQTLACRVWARSGYYQSGGAYGFRDQLQDVMALVHAEPELVRAHLVLCASRQFREGDVQHWWHPPVGRGVRTHCSDDYLWLPLAVCRYVQATGDMAVLDEPAHFVEGHAVNNDEDSYFDLPGRSADAVSVYEHCVIAIRHGMSYGEHGLPLMGSGDWNDGMNLVGIHGKGESVWLAFFLCEVLKQFALLARAFGDAAFATHCVDEALKLSLATEAGGWDGRWYRRAYFDDGTPLGTACGEECQIDSISQSWAVLSGSGDAERAAGAMNEVYARLVRRDDALIQLLDPPFDKSSLDPGYVRGYVPGVRENGGQYTHGAIWAAMAFAAMGDRARAWELLTLINPVNHAGSADDALKYKLEPYVVAADVYACAPHTGRGGWSWYTGSAGWLYRLIVESVLGLRREGNTLLLTPCVPLDWETFAIRYRFGETFYHITVTQVHSGAPQLKAGDLVLDRGISLIDDSLEHHITLTF